MSKPVNKTMIGLFVVGAIVLIVGAIGILGSGKFFREKFTYVMVFEGSIKGLNVGSPMVFRGVKIGTVSGTQMHFDYKTKSFAVLVYVEMEKGRILTVGGYEELSKRIGGKTQYDVMKELIEEGLRAQLEIQSIVTGQLEVALDFYPDKPAVYRGIDKKVMEIPTIPTTLQEIATKLAALPIEEIFYKIQAAVDGISALTQSPELKESISHLNAALKEVTSLVRNVNAQVSPLSEDMKKTIQDTRKLVKNADAQVASVGANVNGAITDSRHLIARLDSGVESLRGNTADLIHDASTALKEAAAVLGELQNASKADSTLMYRLTETLREIEKSARSLRNLTDYFERHPEALLRGKGESGGN